MGGSSLSVAKPTEWFSRAELRALTEPSDLQGWRSVLTDWGLIGGALATAAWWPHPVVIAAAIVLIGARQLGLAILTHEAAHRVLFRSRWLNDLVGNWLCGAPIWLDVDRYRVHHLRHHVHTGTDDDPDTGLVEPFPTTRGGLARKFARDLVGLTGIRRIFGLAAMDLGYLSYTVSTDPVRLPPKSARERLALAFRHLGPVVFANGLLLAAVALAGHAWLYLVWLAAYFSVYSLVLRVRAIAEHACTPGGEDILQNTRTTRASGLARLLWAPHHVNYHLEHHLIMSVPHWRLPMVHRRLAEAGVLGPHNTSPGYASVLRAASSGAAGALG